MHTIRLSTIAGFAEIGEHIALVQLHTGLIKGIYTQSIGGNGAGKLEKTVWARPATSDTGRLNAMPFAFFAIPISL